MRGLNRCRLQGHLDGERRRDAQRRQADRVSAARRNTKSTRRTLLVGRKTMRLRAGQGETADVKLNATGKRLLAAQGKLSAG